MAPWSHGNKGARDLRGALAQRTGKNGAPGFFLSVECGDRRDVPWVFTESTGFMCPRFRKIGERPVCPRTSRPPFCLSPDPVPPNLVPAVNVAQDLLFNERKCDVTAKTSTVSGGRPLAQNLRTSPLHDRSADPMRMFSIRNEAHALGRHAMPVWRVTVRQPWQWQSELRLRPGNRSDPDC